MVESHVTAIYDAPFDAPVRLRRSKHWQSFDVSSRGTAPRASQGPSRRSASKQECHHNAPASPSPPASGLALQKSVCIYISDKVAPVALASPPSAQPSVTAVAKSIIPSMAPFESDTADSNLIPVVAYFAQTVSVGLLLFVVVRFVDQASAALPPSQDTRHRQSKRTRDIRIFTVLTALSFLLAAYFGISRRVSSYLDWASHHNEDAPNTLWSGWYGGTRDREGGGLTSYADVKLGRWWQDTKYSTGDDQLVLGNSKGLWWAQQLVPSMIAWSIFVGVEGLRRAHNPSSLRTIATDSTV